MPRGAFTGARHVSFDDTWLAAGTGVKTYMDLPYGDGTQLVSTNRADFRPQGIIVNSSSDATQQTFGYAMIRGYLWGENDQFADTYRVPLGVPVGLAFRAIYAAGTTARGIKLFEEV